MNIEKVCEYLPTIEKPTYRPGFNARLKWTFAALVIYFVLALIPAYGIHPATFEQFRFFEIILGAKFGSIMTLGVGPIVTAGIILQLLVGSKIIEWRMDREEDRKKFQLWNRFLAVLFCFLEAAAFVLGGAIPVAGGALMASFVILQLAFGGLIVILIDDLVSKWGFGSGVSLIIAAGVGSSIFIAMFSPFAIYQYQAGEQIVTKVGLPSFENPPVGYFWKSLISLFSFDFYSFLTFFAPILATFVVLLVVVYVQDIGVEIPISFAALRGFTRSWELKLLYTSVIPIILTAALVANLRLIANLSGSEQFNSIVFFISPPRPLLEQILTGTLIPIEVLRAFTYTIFLMVFATIFSYFWMQTSGMDPRSVAEQIESFGLQIPGFRKSAKIIESVLNRYIPSLAILSGILIGLLAALADLTGAIGSGTGILLAAMIVYNYYEI